VRATLKSLSTQPVSILRAPKSLARKDAAKVAIHCLMFEINVIENCAILCGDNHF
jgi:hypothetical protein